MCRGWYDFQILQCRFVGAPVEVLHLLLPHDVVRVPCRRGVDVVLPRVAELRGCRVHGLCRLGHRALVRWWAWRWCNSFPGAFASKMKCRLISAGCALRTKWIRVCCSDRGQVGFVSESACPQAWVLLLGRRSSGRGPVVSTRLWIRRSSTLTTWLSSFSGRSSCGSAGQRRARSVSADDSRKFQVEALS